jgi:hypothetical protein
VIVLKGLPGRRRCPNHSMVGRPDKVTGVQPSDSGRDRPDHLPIFECEHRNSDACSHPQP